MFQILWMYRKSNKPIYTRKVSTWFAVLNKSTFFLKAVEGCLYFFPLLKRRVTEKSIKLASCVPSQWCRNVSPSNVFILHFRWIQKSQGLLPRGSKKAFYRGLMCFAWKKWLNSVEMVIILVHTTNLFNFFFTILKIKFSYHICLYSCSKTLKYA